MKIIKTDIEDLVILEPKIYHDDRGYFFEAYTLGALKELNNDFKVLQENVSYSHRGVVRGLHFQDNPHTQAKLIRINQGNILDVVVDLRKDSKTFKKVFSIELSSAKGQMLFVPKGFAHGFSALSENCQISYSCDNYYNTVSENGIHPLDSELAIDWKIPKEEMIISAKDLNQLTFPEVLKNNLF